MSTVLIATASAAKFPEALSASNVSPAASEEIDALMELPTKCEDMDRGQDWSQILRNKIEDISKLRNY